MIKIIFHGVKFVLMGCLIAFGMSYYDNSKPIYLQNILFWILVFIPCVGAYEHVLVSIVKRIKPKEAPKEIIVKKTFSEKLAEKMAEAEIKK